jgi:replicative DNA helicase
LIARLLLFPEDLPLIDLAPDDIYDRQWRGVYKAMQGLASEHRTIDLVSLRPLCPDTDFKSLLSEVGPAHRAPIEEYAAAIKDMAVRRRLVGLLEGVIARTEHGDANSALADLSVAVAKALAESGAGSLLSSSEAIDRYLASERTPAAAGLHWAPWSLNHHLQPVQGGELVIVAARPSVGKTVVAEQMVDAWAMESGKPVLFASLEMSTRKLLARALRRVGEVTRGVLTEDDAQRAREALSARRSVGVWYLDDPRATTTSLRAAATKVKMLGNGLGGVAVDYIGLLRDKGDNEVQRIARISAELKALAREHEIPVLALSQLNRNSMYREDSVPRLEDIRDSGAVEQDADIVLGLHRVIGDSQAVMRVLKNRDGAAGHDINLVFNEERVTLN